MLRATPGRFHRDVKKSFYRSSKVTDRSNSGKDGLDNTLVWTLDGREGINDASRACKGTSNDHAREKFNLRAYSKEVRVAAACFGF